MLPSWGDNHHYLVSDMSSCLVKRWFWWTKFLSLLQLLVQLWLCTHSRQRTDLSSPIYLSLLALCVIQITQVMLNSFYSLLCVPSPGVGTQINWYSILTISLPHCSGRRSGVDYISGWLIWEMRLPFSNGFEGTRLRGDSSFTIIAVTLDQLSKVPQGVKYTSFVS